MDVKERFQYSVLKAWQMRTSILKFFFYLKIIFEICFNLVYIFRVFWYNLFVLKIVGANFGKILGVTRGELWILIFY